MGPRDRDPRTDQSSEERETETPEGSDEYDEEVADSFPASDPPSSPGIIGPRREPE